MRVLIAEDDPGIRSVIERGLTEAGYVVDGVADGAEALAYLETYEYEVVVLDWRMPRVTGVEVIRALRKRDNTVPILLLTARDAPKDRIEGLDSGADDYLVKPFDFGELLARLRALRRRPARANDTVVAFEDLVFDGAALELSLDGHLVVLTRTELLIVELLIDRAPGVVSRSSIAIHAWQSEADAVGSNTIDVHVAHLRTKLAASAAKIETVRGTGYRLVGPAS